MWQFDTAEAVVLTDVFSACSLGSKEKHYGSRHAISLLLSPCRVRWHVVVCVLMTHCLHTLAQ